MGVKLPGWGRNEEQGPMQAMLLQCCKRGQNYLDNYRDCVTAGVHICFNFTEKWKLKVKLNSLRSIGSTIAIYIPANNQSFVSPQCREKNNPNSFCTYFTSLIIGWESVISQETKTSYLQSLYCCRRLKRSQQSAATFRFLRRNCFKIFGLRWTFPLLSLLGIQYGKYFW